MRHDNSLTYVSWSGSSIACLGEGGFELKWRTVAGCAVQPISIADIGDEVVDAEAGEAGAAPLHAGWACRVTATIAPFEFAPLHLI
jgi:hypothetical protein